MGEYLDIILTFAGTVFAGAGLKWIESWVKKAKDRDDTATSLRNELRTELTSLKAEIQATEKQLDEWRQKYYDLYQQYLDIKSQLEAAKALSGSTPVQGTLPLTEPTAR